MSQVDRSQVTPIDWDAIRSEFPVTENYLYFDLANKCPLPVFSTQAIEAYIASQQKSGGDKEQWFATVNSARSRFADMINCSIDDVAFTKNTSEGLNIAANCLPLEAGDTVVLNEHEHPNNVYCWLNLKSKGVNVHWIPAPDGFVTPQTLEEHAPKSMKVLAVSSVTYAPGNRNDIHDLARYCRERGVYLVVDGVQSVGTMNVDIDYMGADILCGSGHKALMCPHGVGLLYIRPEIRDRMHPLYVARAGMEMAAQIEYGEISYALEIPQAAKKFEIGNYNYLGLTVLDCALKRLNEIGMSNIEARLLSLNELLSQGLTAAGFELASPRDTSLGSAIVCFRTGNARSLHEYLVRHNAITTVRRDMIRVSLGFYNSSDDIDGFLALLHSWQTTESEG
ncbi:MAG: aminotransferase class V-fold PLP-dependent enzyme [Spirochaetaceae bacterium]|nr:MAG: aminotransferase class V-fold PLP-dependent enzyme [Spirochaetaceae bacterium]